MGHFRSSLSLWIRMSKRRNLHPKIFHSNSGMKNPALRVKGLLISGQCLLYKYLSSAPEQEHPWPETLKEKLKVYR